MAHIVGVPKQDPCQKCSYPIFLAERLNVGKKVYHRTCLKCARCKSQLTPGSFYETEIDGEYCCETCPDEEKSLNSLTSSGSSPMMMNSNSSISGGTSGIGGLNRLSSSIADRLAFFEHRDRGDDGKRLLQKSLSDEEKSRSLKRIEEDQKNSAYQTSSAFSSFLSNHLSDTTDSGFGYNQPHSDESVIDISRRSSATSTTTTSSDDTVDNLLDSQSPAPELPKSQPPPLIENDDISGIQKILNTSHESSQVDNKHRSNLNSYQGNEGENIKKTHTKIIATNEITRTPSIACKKSAAEEVIKIGDGNNVEQIKKIEQIRPDEIQNDLNNVIVTKDSSEDAVNDNNYDVDDKDDNNRNGKKSIPPSLADIDSSNHSKTINTQEAEIGEKSYRSSMVRARLHQFEIIANRESSESTKCSSSINNVKNNKRINSCKENSTSITNNKNDLEIMKNKEELMNVEKHDYDDDDDDENEVPKKITISNTNNVDDNDHRSTIITTTSPIILNAGEDEIKKENVSYHNKVIQKDECKNEVKEIPLEMNETSVNYDDNIRNKSKETEQQINLSESKQHPNALDVDSIAVAEAIDNKDVDSYGEISSISQVENIVVSASTEKELNDFSANTLKCSQMDDKAHKSDEYPEDLNPFKSDDDDDDNGNNENISSSLKEKRKSLNPFESDEEKDSGIQKLKPPRPPPPKRISTNPFGSDSEDDDDEEEISQSNSVSSGTSSRRTPVPTPRSHLSKSQNQTPEPTPRITKQNQYGIPLKNSGEYYGSNASLSPINNANTKLNTSDQFIREESCRGSTYSLASSGSGTGTKRKTKKAPAPPPPPAEIVKATAKELFPSSAITETDSKKSSPSSSNTASPKFRKKRPAPAPPSSFSKLEQQLTISQSESEPISVTVSEKSENSEILINPVAINLEISQLEKLSDEEKVLLENSSTFNSSNQSILSDEVISSTLKSETEGVSRRKLIALDPSLIEDSNSSTDLKVKEEENVTYRRKIIPSGVDTPIKKDNEVIPSSFEDTDEYHDRQLEKLKDNKEAKNRNRQSHISLNVEDSDPLLNKSIQGKWKRRKGPAPALPVPPRKVIQMLPLQEIRHELEVIEVQQQGLEKQGVMLEKMIRDRCEGQNAEDNSNTGINSKEVEDLILQLFELVNEKNELFRRQAELMYLRRQHRLEQEQADLEYEIRVLMAQPERNKTDSDKAREEILIARLVEVVQLRNEVIECLEMDRLREAEEDMSIKQRLEMYTAKRDEELSKQTPTKLSKKEKKKQKELKKLGKSKKLDADKDADESEISAENQKIKKKKKKFLF